MLRRFLAHSSCPVVLRADDGQKPRIQGYGAVYFSETDPGTEYTLFNYPGYRVIERLMPGCFDRAVREDDVRALFNHDVNQILGRNKSGTCQLSTDNRGLKYSIDPPDTQCARDLMESLKRGDVTGSSFSFDYSETTERDVRGPDGSTTIYLEVRAVKLYDVSPVTYPAYESTTAQARSADAADAEKLGAEIVARSHFRQRNGPGKQRRARAILLD